MSLIRCLEKLALLGGGGAPDFGFNSLNIYSVIVMQKKRTELKCAFGTMSFE